MAPVVTVSESGDGGFDSSGVTSIERAEGQSESNAPPSGESGSPTSDSGGAGVVHVQESSGDSLMQSLAQLVKTDRHGGCTNKGHVCPSSPTHAPLQWRRYSGRR